MAALVTILAALLAVAVALLLPHGILGWRRLLAERPGRGPDPAPGAPAPPAPPPLADPLRLTVYELERATGRSPEVSTTAELLLVPAFAELVRHFGRPEFDVPTLAAYASGDNLVPSWAALVALARRPAVPELRPRALFWLNQFHPRTRDLVLRLLEAWFPDDPLLAGRVLVALEENWLRSGSTMVVLDEFLRRRAAAGPLRFGELKASLREEQQGLVRGLLAACDPALVAPLRLELAVDDDEDAAEEGSKPAEEPRADSPSGPPPTPAPMPGLAGSVHKPGKFPAPVVYARRGFDEARARLQRALTQSPPRSVVVAGEAGVGKTTLARALAADLSRKGWRIFETSAQELNAGMSFVGQLEGRIRELLRQAEQGRPGAWLVRDFHQLLWSGRYNQNPTGLLEMLLPAIESGVLVVIGEAPASSLDLALVELPQLERLVEIARLEPPREEELGPIAGAWLAARPANEPGRVPAALLAEAVALSRHHLAARGMPAGLLRLLEGARELAAAAGRAATVDDLLEALAQVTGLPVSLLDERRALDLAATRAWFGSRVIGQGEAVDGLIERLALVKAGVASPSRPYAVFLFAGPTGTGKTELVKALATFLFGSAERLVRLDMSELQDAGALDRLVAAGPGAAGSLASRVRRQPFSVVLLDEFEKAHPRVWDLFLQVFDDGRLTDARGDTVDFRNTFIILTSNLGAKLGGGERLGFANAGGGFSASEVRRAVSQAFRPEFLNRIDRTIVFRPLSRETMRDILRKQIREAFERRGLRRREWAVEIEASALDFLLERGFTHDLGARPLQRSLERHLLAPLAQAIVEHRAPEGDQFLFVRADGEQLAVEFVDPDAPSGVAPAPRTASADLGRIAWDAHGTAGELATLRAHVETLEAAVAGGEWPERKSGWLAESGEPGFWRRADRFAVLGRVEYMDRIESGVRSARSLLSRLEGGERPGARAGIARAMVRRLAQQLVLLEGARREAVPHGPRDAFVAIEPAGDGVPAAANAWRDQLASMYERWARARGMRVQALEPPHEPGGRGPAPRWLAVSGFAAWETLRGEEGLHVLEAGTAAAGQQRSSARVRVVLQPPEPGGGAEGMARQLAEGLRGPAPAPQVVRRYREQPAPLARDLVRGWRTGRIERIWDGDFDLVPTGADEDDRD